MIGDGKGSFWCGTEGKYMSSDQTSRARAGPAEEEEEEKSSATRFELGGPKGALRFDETTPSPGGRATAAARGTAAGGSASAPGSTLGGSDGNDGASAAVAWPAVTAARLAASPYDAGARDRAGAAPEAPAGGSGRSLRTRLRSRPTLG
eukprot:scaffold22049_cov59-Phaeocystis_antarctica.AAC.2